MSGIFGFLNNFISPLASPLTIYCALAGFSPMGTFHFNGTRLQVEGFVHLFTHWVNRVRSSRSSNYVRTYVRTSLAISAEVRDACLKYARTYARRVVMRAVAARLHG